MKPEVIKRRILKQFEKEYYTVLLPSVEFPKRWSRRVIIIPTKYKPPRGKDKFYYHIAPSMKENDNRLLARIPKRAANFILNYRREYLRYLSGTWFGKDYITLGFRIENLPIVEKLFKIRKRKHIKPEHLQKLHSGRDRYNNLVIAG